MAMVSGTLRLSNGELPAYFFKGSDSVRLAEGVLSCDGTIIGGHIYVTIDGLQKEMLDDEVLRVAGYIMDNMVLTRAVMEGIGASYSIENYWKEDNLVLHVIPEKAPSVEALGHEEREVFTLISDNAQLRYAIRDFNQGMVYSQDSPYLFYRAIETMARLTCGKDDFQSFSKRDWRLFHKRIGTSYDDLKELHNFAKRQRHGPHAYITRHQYISMMGTVRLFLTRTIQYMLEEEF
ncbi:MAG TPA: hypothetical protein G4O07_01430 [Dehalococcoidia bacterium]|nr:hypothetical protein [Dehalococcoidia bacterium]